MGGTSVPMLLFQIAAIRKESIGTEVPPTKAVAPAKTRAPAPRTRSVADPTIIPPPRALRPRLRPHPRRAPARAAPASAAVSRRA
ncbi:DUF6053 domain-containing protein [Lysobacter enzymogenes]|uniref:DUF6053 domain-containing protein n=1 Tax=Lysobacter enzymogenes TaxID=69 RepID=UPI003CCC95F7